MDVKLMMMMICCHNYYTIQKSIFQQENCEDDRARLQNSQVNHETDSNQVS